jgi:hypothetical protein
MNQSARRHDKVFNHETHEPLERSVRKKAQGAQGI